MTLHTHGRLLLAVILTTGPTGLRSAAAQSTPTIQASARSDAFASACSADHPHLPPNVELADSLRQPIATMIERSATFRAQCREIADSSFLRVRVRVDTQILQRTFHARSVISRFASGDLVAETFVAPVVDPTEWLAHEFEHLIEQLEGVSLSELCRHSRRAWESSEGMFETARAVSVGRTVAAEVRRARSARRDAAAAARSDH